MHVKVKYDSENIAYYVVEIIVFIQKEVKTSLAFVVKI